MAAPVLTARSVVFVNKVGTDDAGYNPVGRPWSHLTIVSALADLAANYPAASASNPHVVSVGPGVFISAAIAIPPWTFICGSCDGQGNPDTEIQLTGNITAASGWSANSTQRGGIGGVTVRRSSGTPVIDFTMPAPVAGNPARTIQVWDLKHNLTQELFEATSTADVWERSNTVQDGVNTDVITQTGGTSRLFGFNLCAAIITIRDKASFATAGQWQGVVNTVAGSGLVANSVAAAGCTLRLTLSTLRALTLAETAPGVITVYADAPSIPLVANISFTGTATDADLIRLTDGGAIAGISGYFQVASPPPAALTSTVGRVCQSQLLPAGRWFVCGMAEFSTTGAAANISILYADITQPAIPSDFGVFNSYTEVVTNKSIVLQGEVFDLAVPTTVSVTLYATFAGPDGVNGEAWIVAFRLPG